MSAVLEKPVIGEFGVSRFARQFSPFIEMSEAGKRKVYVYRPNTEPETLESPAEVSGEPLLRGFGLKLKEIRE